MKRFLLALAFLMVPFTAMAQVALDPANQNPAANITALKETRWMPMVNLASIATAGSHRIPAPMDGVLQEAWMTLDTPSPAAAGNFRINVSISRRGGAVFNVGQFIFNTNALRGGDPVPLTFDPGTQGGAIFTEGDAIVIGIPTITGAAASVGRINLRAADR